MLQSPLERGLRRVSFRRKSHHPNRTVGHFILAIRCLYPYIHLKMNLKYHYHAASSTSFGVKCQNRNGFDLPNYINVVGRQAAVMVG